MVATYEDHLTVFLDLLGFSEACKSTDERLQTKILILLTAISKMQADFADSSNLAEGRVQMRPIITTFSDHIVASYPLSRVTTGRDEHATLSLVLFDVNLRVARIAAAALRSGFLIRGGVARGSLFHSVGVVFGPAMIQAYEMESKVASHPRVVISPTVFDENGTVARTGPLPISLDTDGALVIDYFFYLLASSARPGATHRADVKEWFDEVMEILRDQVEHHRSSHNRIALSKWLWFIRKFLDALNRTNPVIIKTNGIDTRVLSDLAQVVVPTPAD